jgi:hypothetical protein
VLIAAAVAAVCQAQVAVRGRAHEILLDPRTLTKE